MNPLRQCRATLLAGILVGLPLAAQADDRLDHERQYEACIALTYRNAGEALESARVWQARGGGAAARHCAAMALLEAGRHAQAATELEELAADLPPDGSPRAEEVLAQAANIWLLGGQPEPALSAIDAALAGSPGQPGLLVDRARILAELGQYERALDDLDTAVGEAPEDDDLAAFRAAALRRLGRLDEALEEARRAVALNPENPSAWLEQALARLQTGDREGARADLRTTAGRFAGTPAGDSASRQLHELGAR